MGECYKSGALGVCLRVRPGCQLPGCQVHSSYWHGNIHYVRVSCARISGCICIPGVLHVSVGDMPHCEADGCCVEGSSPMASSIHQDQLRESKTMHVPRVGGC